MIARDADQWRSNALDEAAHIVTAAREEASALVRSAQHEADSTVAAARLEAERTVAEAQAIADEVRATTEEHRTQGEMEVARLQQVAADHAQHLRRHLSGVLDQLDSASAPPKPQQGDDL